MSRYETEEEQIEAFKSWWNKNGTKLLSAILVVVLAFSGWRYWTNTQYVEAANSSSMYELLQASMQQGNFGEVSREALKLIQEEPKSPYASGAALLYATYSLEKGNSAEAIEHLNWVVKNAPDLALKVTAQTRLARVYIDEEKYTEAEAQLAQLNALNIEGAAKGSVDYISGMLALQQKDSEKAYSAFSAVVANPETEKNLLGLAQIQLDDLAK
ncbi:tetratricopeptide repeat protein [Thiomicrorhabdus sp. Kp2]|uniref:YfgM family protein n=1 Tax=Thiomicrorhabdus sp. Kp2 TaxID=1123518 RepID=UPI0004191C2F|nr:tetratricopeptide repeat protein [Thiomicrorhabdus sp. Kp2]